MKKVTVRSRILGNYGIIWLMMLAIGGFTYLRLASIERATMVVKSSVLPGLHITDMIRSSLGADYALTTRLSFMDPTAKAGFESAKQENRAKLDRLLVDYEATIPEGGERRTFDDVLRAFPDYRQAQQAIMRIAGTSNDSRAIGRRITEEFDPPSARLAALVDALTDDNNRRGVAAVAQVQSEIRSLQIGMALGFAVGLVFILLSGARLTRLVSAPLERLAAVMDVMRQGDFTQRMKTARRDEFGDLAEGFNRMADEVMGLVGQVQMSGIRVSTSMTEIAATSKQQQATASEVAATTTQIGATSREISATSKELVRTMNEVSTVAEHTAGLATSGQSGLSHMVESMGQVMEAADLINAKLAVLSDKAGGINQVVTTITKVADQTNLLSLNAAIEAEKAGEYGRGFAVVSSEIRRLADQTAVATYDIEEMVKEIQSAVSAGVMGMDKFSVEVRRGMHDVHEISGKLSAIIAQVQALVPRFETVNEGMQAQATGAEQISEALLQLTETTQQTVESLRQSSGAIDELNQVSGSLHNSISRFKLVA